MKVQGLSPQTDERTEDLQPTLFWKEYISSAKEATEVARSVSVMSHAALARSLE